MSMDKGEILKEGIYNSHEPLIHWQLAIISRSSLPFFFFFMSMARCWQQGLQGNLCQKSSEAAPSSPRWIDVYICNIYKNIYINLYIKYLQYHSKILSNLTVSQKCDIS